eukprot:c9225_g1_i3.p1 GENE.c9225_g1_i3~~c9225_g1_i3.p1  ORF type:complete len:1076 (-),score=274.31 c9225_g1_i3:35-3073(-)
MKDWQVVTKYKDMEQNKYGFLFCVGPAESAKLPDESPRRTWILAAASTEQRDLWINVMQRIITGLSDSFPTLIKFTANTTLNTSTESMDLSIPTSAPTLAPQRSSARISDPSPIFAGQKELHQKMMEMRGNVVLGLAPTASFATPSLLPSRGKFLNKLVAAMELCLGQNKCGVAEALADGVRDCDISPIDVENVLVRRLGAQYYTCLSAYSQHPPNIVHTWLASEITQGTFPVIISSAIDNCIETQLKEFGYTLVILGSDESENIRLLQQQETITQPRSIIVAATQEAFEFILDSIQPLLGLSSHTFLLKINGDATQPASLAFSPARRRVISKILSIISKRFDILFLGLMMEDIDYSLANITFTDESRWTFQNSQGSRFLESIQSMAPTASVEFISGSLPNCGKEPEGNVAFDDQIRNWASKIDPFFAKVTLLDLALLYQSATRDITVYQRMLGVVNAPAPTPNGTCFGTTNKLIEKICPVPLIQQQVQLALAVESVIQSIRAREFVEAYQNVPRAFALAKALNDREASFCSWPVPACLALTMLGAGVSTKQSLVFARDAYYLAFEANDPDGIRVCSKLVRLSEHIEEATAISSSASLFRLILSGTGPAPSTPDRKDTGSMISVARVPLDGLLARCELIQAMVSADSVVVDLPSMLNIPEVVELFFPNNKLDLKLAEIIRPLIPEALSNTTSPVSQYLASRQVALKSVLAAQLNEYFLQHRSQLHYFDSIKFYQTLALEYQTLVSGSISFFPSQHAVQQRFQQVLKEIVLPLIKTEQHTVVLELFEHLRLHCAISPRQPIEPFAAVDVKELVEIIRSQPWFVRKHIEDLISTAYIASMMSVIHVPLVSVIVEPASDPLGTRRLSAKKSKDDARLVGLAKVVLRNYASAANSAWLSARGWARLSSSDIADLRADETLTAFRNKALMGMAQDDDVTRICEYMKQRLPDPIERTIPVIDWGNTKSWLTSPTVNPALVKEFEDVVVEVGVVVSVSQTTAPPFTQIRTLFPGVWVPK